MKWKDILSGNYYTGLSLVIVLIMMVLLAFFHKRNLSELHRSLSSVYIDRLVAERHLYDLSHKYYEKKLLVTHLDDGLHEKQILANDAIHDLTQSYEQTYLTDEESRQWETLKKDMGIALQFEQHFTYPESPIDKPVLAESLTARYDMILTQLNLLAEVQLIEANKLIAESDQILASNNLTTQLSVGLILVLCMLIFLLSSSTQIKSSQSFYERFNRSV